MEDREIVDLYLARDETALARTRDKYEGCVRATALHILRDRETADEIANDVLLAAWNSIPPQEPADLSTYLAKLTRRICIDRVRRDTAQKRGGGETILSLDELDACLPARFVTESEVDARLLGERIDAFLRTLPARHRWMFLRRYWHFDTVAEIAQACACSENTVKVTLMRVRNQLRACLSKEV